MMLRFRRAAFLGILAALSTWSWETSSAHPSAPSDLYRITAGASGSVAKFSRMAIPKGGELVLADFVGPGKITYFYFTDGTRAPWNSAFRVNFYQGLVLKIYWDGEVSPSVNVPLSDFFGAIGGRTVDYQSELLQINHGCYMSYIPMPFSKRAKVVVVNDGDRDYAEEVAYGIDCESSPEFAAEKSRLHCSWRRSNPVRNGLHDIVEIEGRGQYVGGFLQVHSNFSGWVGEGDTLFEVDGRKMTHSPGTEDEYGACWEGPGWEAFASPMCGHLLNDHGTNRMYRWYVTNPVRFQKSLKVQIQNQHQNGIPTTVEADDYTSVAYWYQEEPHEHFSLPGFRERTAASRTAADAASATSSANIDSSKAAFGNLPATLAAGASSAWLSWSSFLL